MWLKVADREKSRGDIILEEVAANQYQALVHPLIVFDSGKFNGLNRHKVDKVRYFLFRDRKYRFAVCVGQKDDAFFVPFSAPFSTFVSLKEKWRVLQLENTIECFDTFAARAGIRYVEIVLPPPIYAESLVSSLQNILLRKGYMVECQELNFSIRLNFEAMEDYVVSLPSNGKKNLRIARECDLRLHQCKSIDEKRAAYEIIKRNREWKGYPLRMNWDQVLATIAVVKHDFHMVEKDGAGIAAAMVFYVTKEVAQIIYWGDIPGAAAWKTMNYLACCLVDYYRGKGMKYLDIGPSTEKGVPNYGLCDFKSSIGCETQAKFVMKKYL